MHVEGVMTDEIVILMFLDLCATHVLLAKGKSLHIHTNISVEQCDVAIGTALINMYGKCGCIEKAKEIFSKLSDRNLLTFTCMISMFAQHGYDRDAARLFCRMHDKGLSPDKVSYTSILCACGHGGLIKDGLGHFLAMEILHGIVPIPDHFNCVIDLLGKAGLADKASHLIRNMPFQPTAMSWTILVDAYRRLSGVGCANHLLNFLLEVDSKDAASYVTFSNMCVKG
jgi:pentatricopeptide repeat protein